MTYRFTILAALGLLTAFIATPAHMPGLQAQAVEPHDHDHAATTNAQDKPSDPSREAMMASMRATDAKLDELVRKMTAAKGAAKSAAMATLLTALVQEQRMMHASMMTNTSMMSNMMQMMDKMGGMGGRGDAGSTMPKK